MNFINTDLNFWFYWLIFCGIILSGYFVMAFSVYYLLYSVLGQKLKALRTQAQKIIHHYGLYFTFWDKLLGTQDPEYEEKRLSGAF
jgi:hypothetical protein